MMDPASLVQYASQATYVNYLAAGSIALVAYDYVVMLPVEIKHIWFARWNIGKGLYIVTRYLAFTDIWMMLLHQIAPTLSDVGCEILYHWSGWSYFIAIALADGVLAIRTYIICSRRPIWAALLLSSFVGVWATAFTFLAQRLAKVAFDQSVNPLPGCLMVASTDVLFVAYVAMMCFELFIFGVTLMQGFESFGHSPNLLTTVLYRDALLFLGLLSTLSVANVIVLLHASAALSNLFLAPQRALHAVLTARIILHLRQAAKKADNAGVTSVETQGTLKLESLPMSQYQGPEGSLLSEESWLDSI